MTTHKRPQSEVLTFQRVETGGAGTGRIASGLVFLCELVIEDGAQAVII